MTGHSHYFVVKRMRFVVILTLGIFLLELVGGILTNSLALLSDAGHVFADVFALGLSWVALSLAGLPADRKRTFGYLRAEVLAATINGVTLCLVAIWIFVEAFHRIREPLEVKSLEMFLIATIGLTVNMVVYLKLRGIAQHNLNVRSAFLHVLGDMLASLGVIAGGIVMLVTRLYIVDPIISVLIGLIILRGAFGILRESANILLEGVPRDLKLAEVESALRGVEGVEDIHELHVWSVSSRDTALSCHVMTRDQTTHSAQSVLERIQSELKEKFKIEHTTIQFECGCCASKSVECIFTQGRE
jgi:cobalt-zinc-cadmium efflux system protein